MGGWDRRRISESRKTSQPAVCAVRLYTVANKSPVSKKVERKDWLLRLSSDLHACLIACVYSHSWTNTYIHIYHTHTFTYLIYHTEIRKCMLSVASIFYYEKKNTVGEGVSLSRYVLFVNSFLRFLSRISFSFPWVPYLWQITFVHLLSGVFALLAGKHSVFIFLEFTIFLHAYMSTIFIFLPQTLFITLSFNLEAV